MRWDTETFKKEVEKNKSYKLLSEYTGCHNKVKILHEKCNNIYEVTPTNFLAGRRCPKCAILEHNRDIAKKKRNRNRTTESFKKEIYDLVGDEYTVLGEYVSTDTPIKVKHNICNTIYNSKPYNFLAGRRCPKCSKIKSSEKHKIGIEEIKRRVEKILGDDYEVLLKQPYIDNNTKIKVYHTKCGKLFEATPTNLLKGRGCSHCNKSEKYTTEKYQELLGDNYTVLSEYKTNKDPITVRHNKCGYEWTARALDILHPWCKNDKTIERCPKCNKTLGKSYGEKEVYKYLKEDLGIKNIIENDRTILDGKELDIYLPDYNLAIEYDGLYWHSENFVDKKYHINKTNECKKKGIQLIHLMEDEWTNKQELVKEKLKYMTHHSTKSVYARKCYIEEISASDKNEFLEENHIQGKDSAQIKLGLWYEEGNEAILVAVMTFCKPRLSLGQKNNKTKFDYELSRYATQNGFNVVGGFSKLFKYFERNYEWKNIITYADLRWSVGNLYLKNGFVLDHISEPSYSYINKSNIKRFNRFKFRKQELQKQFPNIYSNNKTEFQIMKEAGYLKIYDCGNMVFYYNK
jgi:Zn ribbon nucleic-acid-binding protein